MNVEIINEPYDFYECYEGDNLRFFLGMCYADTMNYFANCAIREFCRATAFGWSYRLKIESSVIWSDNDDGEESEELN